MNFSSFLRLLSTLLLCLAPCQSFTTVIRQGMRISGAAPIHYLTPRQGLKVPPPCTSATALRATDADTNFSSASSSASSSKKSSSAAADSRPREDRLKEEISNCEKMKDSELKQELKERGISSSTAAFSETSEYVQALAAARVDGVRKNADDAGAIAVGTTPIAAAPEEEKKIYRSAILRTLGWVGAASLFGIGLLIGFGPQTGEEFFAGYLVEQSLSVDNLFVFLLLFEYFKVPLECQDRVLNWGIAGAVVMRAIMIGLGAAALRNFHEILLVFAGILVYSSVKVLFDVEEDDEEDPSDNAIVKFSQNIMSSTPEFDGDRFFTMVDGVKKATPLFICMIAVEISDVVFAVDSIPAVFGITENPLVVFTSNMFAIMGLRSLYTILSKAASDLKYLEPAVAVVLGFIGWKMIAEYFGYIIPTEIALCVVGSLLATGVGLSVWERKLEAAKDEVS